MHIVRENKAHSTLVYWYIHRRDGGDQLDGGCTFVYIAETGSFLKLLALVMETNCCRIAIASALTASTHTLRARRPF